MSDKDQMDVDKGALEDTKDHLAHVETKTGETSIHPVYKCESCGSIFDIPGEELEKMEKDEEVHPPNCEKCGGNLKISVTG